MTDKPVSVYFTAENRTFWLHGLFWGLVTLGLAFALRMLEWPCWQNPEYRLGSEWLLATHDAYHWVAGAEGFGHAVGHPMAVMLRGMADLLGTYPAAVAFWFPALLSCFVAVIVYAWVWALGSMEAGVAAGLLTSLAPGFLARTLLGYYDTDLVTLFFPLLMTLAPACWAMRYMLLPQLILKKLIVGSGLAAARRLWGSSLAYALPTLGGPLFFGFSALLMTAGWTRARQMYRLRQWLCRPWVLILLWLGVGSLFLSGELLQTITHQLSLYMKKAEVSGGSGALALIYPPAGQALTEVQDLGLLAVLAYFHPWHEAAALGLLGFVWVIFRRPGALFLLPLAALGLLSTKMGGRMVMFGAPIVAVGLTLPLYWMLQRLLRKLRPNVTGILTSALLLALLVAPFVNIIPAMSQGPMINRRHAEMLSRAQTVVPKDATLWLWWDWGYAAHHFAHRLTIADGARNAGAPLYLSAAVLGTDNPRFARQLIRYTSQFAKGRDPFDEEVASEVFAGLDAQQAQDLMDKLRSPETALVEGEGRQFVTVSFEMLRLGFWISNFGNWDFVTRQGEGAALSILPQAVAYNLDKGEVLLDDSATPIRPASISVFEETGVTRRDYIQQWFDSHPRATAAQRQEFLSGRRNVHFFFNRITDEKLAMDANLYNSLMVRLLVGNPQDPAISPYFKLVYDNVFCRIYEVL